MTQFQWFLVEGLNPEPWTASLASVGQKDGKKFVQFYKPEPLRLYQESFKEMFVEQNPHAEMRPGELCLLFYFWRQLTLNEIFEGKNRRSHVADATNLQKSTEDALQGILYKNDSLVRSVQSRIIEQNRDTTSRILIGIGGYDEQEEETQQAEALASILSQPSEAVDPKANQRDFDVEEVF